MMVSTLLLAGCIPAEPLDDGGSDLARLLQGRVVAETRTCVPVSPLGALTVIDSATLIYDRGETTWVNRLRGECPGLQPGGTLIVEPSTGQYCSGDRFRQLEWGAIIPGPDCTLGEFTGYRRPD